MQETLRRKESVLSGVACELQSKSSRYGGLLRALELSRAQAVLDSMRQDKVVIDLQAAVARCEESAGDITVWALWTHRSIPTLLFLPLPLFLPE